MQGPSQPARHFFLESVGVGSIRVDDHRDIHQSDAWLG